jgi:uroporphyrin-III C-methyltransferase
MTVYLVGAGPGDPGLLTVKGRELLADADVVLYDDLVDPRLLGLTSAHARMIGVGKSVGRLGSERATPQEEINRLLRQYGRSGACVVRLKGGDPFVFGRGGEEALALQEAGIPFEVVPGVSSALAAPAYAGIPVTHRGLASSVAIVTGHEAPEKGQDAAHVDWGRLATATDTLVILMGIGQLPRLVEHLIDGGRSPETPAAAVEQGTTAHQRVVTGALCELPSLVREAALQSPAAIVVGEVVRLGRQLAWFTPLGALAELVAEDGQVTTGAADYLTEAKAHACA